MDCVDSTPKLTEITLLTQADKIAQLEKLFTKFHRSSDVFLPDESFYDPINGPEDAERMANNIFKYLGIKHRSVEFHIDPDQDRLVSYAKRGGTSQIILGWKNQKDPILCGAVIAHVIVHHLLISRLKLDLGTTSDNEEITDLGTIYAGLGVLIMNSFGGNNESLGRLAKQNYIAECLDYFNERRLVASVWQPYVLPEIIKEVTTIPKERYVSYVRMRQARRKSTKRRLIFVGVCLLVFVSFGLFLYKRQPRYLSAEMQDQKDSISLLKMQYENCTEIVKRKKQTWDQTDIFMLRQIEADQTRCTSLKNRYNYEADQFNSKL